MTSDGEALLRAICEHPREDTPRLMYADWLEENGQKERAEFIRFQCEFPEWDESHPRCRELTERYRQFEPFFKEWIRALPRPHGVRWEPQHWDRGFLDRVELGSTKAFADHADTIFAASPVRGLDVSTVTDRTVVRLFPSAYLRRLDRFVLRGACRAHTIRQVATSPDLTNLNELCLWAGCPDEGAEALADSPHLGALTCLNFANHALTDRGVTALIESDRLRGLKRLVLRHYGVAKLSPGVVARLKERFGEAE